MKEYLDLLKTLSLFDGIDAGDIPVMLRCLGAAQEEYAKGGYIRMEGDPADFIGLVLEGTVQVVQDHYDGRRHVMACFGPGAMFAEAFACAGAPELPVSILSATDSVILFLSMERILDRQEGSCRFHDPLIRNLLRIVAHKNMLLSQKLGYVSHKTTAEKLMAFLSDQAKEHRCAEFTIPYNRQALADYLGVERSAMSAEISKLQKQGIIETRGSHFRLLKSCPYAATIVPE